MNNQQCKYSEYVIKSAFEQYLRCNLTHNNCVKQKYCHRQKKAINTDDWQQCPILERKDKCYDSKESQ